MIMGEGGWPCDDINKLVFLQGEIVFKLSPVALLKLMFFIACFSLIYITMKTLLRQCDFFKQLLVQNELIFNL